MRKAVIDVECKVDDELKAGELKLALWRTYWKTMGRPGPGKHRGISMMNRTESEG